MRNRSLINNHYCSRTTTTTTTTPERRKQIPHSMHHVQQTIHLSSNTQQSHQQAGSILSLLACRQIEWQEISIYIHCHSFPVFPWLLSSSPFGRCFGVCTRNRRLTSSHAAHCRVGNVSIIALCIGFLYFPGLLLVSGNVYEWSTLKLISCCTFSDGKRHNNAMYQGIIPGSRHVTFQAVRLLNKITIGNSRRFWGDSCQFLSHVCSMSPCQPVAERCVFFFFFFFFPPGIGY